MVCVPFSAGSKYGLWESCQRALTLVLYFYAAAEAMVCCGDAQCTGSCLKVTFLGPWEGTLRGTGRDRYPSLLTWKLQSRLFPLPNCFLYEQRRCGVEGAARPRGHENSMEARQPLSCWGRACLWEWVHGWGPGVRGGGLWYHQNLPTHPKLWNFSPNFFSPWLRQPRIWASPCWVFMRHSLLSQVVWLSSKALLQLPGQGLFSGVNLHRIRP